MVLPQLQQGDIVYFDDFKLKYEVLSSFLCYEEGENDTIFARLGLDKYNFASNAYGYKVRSGDWPCFNHEDYEAATRIVAELAKLTKVTVARSEGVIFHNYGTACIGEFSTYDFSSCDTTSVSKSEYKGQLEGFPKAIVEKMLFYQEQQGNPKDVSVFEEKNTISKSEGGFDWRETTEGGDFWEEVIMKKDFDLFFSRYPFEITPSKKQVKQTKTQINNYVKVHRTNPRVCRGITIAGKTISGKKCRTSVASRHLSNRAISI